MKKLGLIVLGLLISLQVSASTTTTTTTFKDVSYNGVSSKENEFGEKVLYKEATIETKNFKVKNFWDKFSDSKNGESVYNQVSKIGIFELNVKSSFACVKGNLDSKGCSGQKPFLLNDGTLNNLDMQKTADGSALPAGEYRIPFDDAANYAVGNDDAFYALDVDRNENFYKEPSTPPPPGKKSFFGYIIDLFKNHFSKDTRVFGDPLTPEESAHRDRYIANIVYGHDEDHRLKQAVEGASATAIDTMVPAANEPVSLLDYESQLLSETTGCKGFILSFSPSSLRCRMMTGFGISNWMPFFNSEATYEVESKSVMADTENTLLALAGDLNNKDYIKKTADEVKRNGFLSQIFKPMTFMFSSMTRFWFGSRAPKTVEALVAEFKFDKYLPLTFAFTDGNQVTGFKHFALMGVESVYGTEVESCKVKDTRGFFGWASSTRVFKEGIASDTSFDLEDGFFGSFRYDESDYDQLDIRSERVWFSHHDFAHVSTTDWLNWCKRNQGKRGKGIFGRFFASFGRMFANPATYDDQLDNLLAEENYSVVEYKEKVHRGLILHLKEVELNLGTAGTSTTYKLLNVR